MASWSRAFPGRPEQVSQARRFAASVLAGRPEAIEAMLVVSELSTNAVQHTASGAPAGMFVVTVEREDGRSRVSVQDMGSDGKPAIMRAPDGEWSGSGRGLRLVAALVKEWDASRNALGWAVWAEMDCTDDDRAVLLG